jgi:hypothetical protein
MLGFLGLDVDGLGIKLSCALFQRFNSTKVSAILGRPNIILLVSYLRHYG